MKLFLWELQCYSSLRVPSVLAISIYSVSLSTPVTIPSNSIKSSWQNCCLKDPTLCPRPKHLNTEKRLCLSLTFNICQNTLRGHSTVPGDLLYFSMNLLPTLLFSSFFFSSNFNHHLFTPLIWSLYLVFQRTTTVLPNKISQPTCTSITVFLFPFCSNLKPTSLLLLYNSSTHTQIWHWIISVLPCHQFSPFCQNYFHGYKIDINVNDLGKKQLLALLAQVVSSFIFPSH